MRLKTEKHISNAKSAQGKNEYKLEWKPMKQTIKLI